MFLLGAAGGVQGRQVLPAADRVPLLRRTIAALAARACTQQQGAGQVSAAAPDQLHPQPVAQWRQHGAKHGTRHGTHVESCTNYPIKIGLPRQQSGAPYSTFLVPT